MMQVRKQIVPVNRKWPLQSLIGTLRDLFPVNKAKSHARHVLIEYVMLRDVNDSLEDAHRYASHACAVLCCADNPSLEALCLAGGRCAFFIQCPASFFLPACSASASNHGTCTHAA